MWHIQMGVPQGHFTAKQRATIYPFAYTIYTSTIPHMCFRVFIDPSHTMHARAVAPSWCVFVIVFRLSTRALYTVETGGISSQSILITINKKSLRTTNHTYEIASRALAVVRELKQNDFEFFENAHQHYLSLSKESRIPPLNGDNEAGNVHVSDRTARECSK